MNIVVVGGGFAGIKAALELDKRNLGRVTLISNTPYFLYHAVLYATVTGKSYAESVVPLEEIFASTNVKVIEDSLKTVEPDRKLVVCDKSSYHYDKLIIAIGSINNYFGIPGMDQNSFSISTLDHVVEFREHIHDEIRDGRLEKNYVIVGAGATGVELSGAFKQYLESLAEMHHIKHPHIRVTLVEAADRVLPQCSKTASKLVGKRLRDLGVKVLLNHKVEQLTDDFVVINNRKVPTETAVWTSGVANNPFFAQHPDLFKLNQRGRVEVNAYLEAYRNIFVLGDNNNVRYSGMAWPALDQAVFVAKHLKRLKNGLPQVRFRPKQPPSGTPIGKRWAYVEWHGIYAAGLTGYLIRRLMELRGYTALLPWNRAIASWRAHFLPEISVDE